MSDRPLTPEELLGWQSFRFMVEETSIKVSRELSGATGLSGGEFGILTFISKSLNQEVRQQELADGMRWDRTRLSHQLTRMEGRGLVERKKNTAGATMVVITPLGTVELARVAPVLAKAVRTHFFRKLTKEHLAKLTEILAALRDEGKSSPAKK